MKNRKQLLLETGIYALIWLVVFAVPLLGYSTGEGIKWIEVRRFWLSVLPFFALFLVNNYLLIPKLFLNKRYGWYVVSAVLLIVLLFAVVPMIFGSPRFPSDRHLGQPFGKQGFYLPDRPPPQPVNHFSADSAAVDNLMPGTPASEFGPMNRGPESQMHPPRGPMPFKWGRILNDWLLAVLLIGFNIAIRLLFKSIEDSRRLKELESQNLKAELDYLKAQVNPHFFMNTLNNIHALIDIDGEQAKCAIIELSKIMRYVLYEADRPLVPLSREIEFLNNYISLMRIRYSGDVEIKAAYPDSAKGLSIPPLMLVTLIENAFKHGIDYSPGSYIYSELSVDGDRLTYWVCNKSLPGPPSDPGVGLDNLRKRLELLYGGKYKLEISDSGGKYQVKMTIPLDL